MKTRTPYADNLKDNIAAAAVLAATLVAILGSMVNSNEARAEDAVVKMDAIVVTAPRIETIHMEPIVVTATHESKILLAAK